jgi:hypothetical protein
MKDQLVGMFLVVESTGHEHYRTGHIAAAVGNCYLIQFDKMEESEAPPLPPMELYTLEELSRTCEDLRIVWHGYRNVADGHLPTNPTHALTGSLAGLTYPLLETQDEWVLHGFSFANYLAELGPSAQQDIYSKSSIDLALRDAFRKMRSLLMTAKGLTEDEAISLMSIGVDFGVTQVVDGNWGIHAIIKKSLFAGMATA